MHEQLAKQIREALEMLGTGFLEDNPALAERLATGTVDLKQWFDELLRLVYRFIFLMVAEDRDLLHPPDTPTDVRSLYAGCYSFSTLRITAGRGGGWVDGADHFETMRVVFSGLGRGDVQLGLPALGGLFAPNLLPNLENAHLRNCTLLEAVRKLAWVSDPAGVIAIDWRAMKTEDLGAVYESLLELRPQIGPSARSLILDRKAIGQGGNQRKSTGAYYTPDDLVQALLDSTLDPVLDRIQAKADYPARAILGLSVLDPACGSGHFLLAATRRIAARLARSRTRGTPTPADIRHALRDVVRTCIFGVDRDPFAVDLTKVALWIEAAEPGLPLGAFDTQIVCGDALLGVLDLKVLQNGIPDAAYRPVCDDNRAIARYYAARNRREKSEAGRASAASAQTVEGPGTGLILRESSDSNAATISRACNPLAHGANAQLLARLCDLFVAAFLLPKRQGGMHAGTPHGGMDVVPTTKTLTETANGTGPSQPLLDLAAAAVGTARVLHWPLAFPSVLARGGFDVVIGNPPYSAAVGLREREATKSAHPRTAGASNTCADFISLALPLLREGGWFGLVVPKSSTYSHAWAGVRELILPHLASAVDVRQAWPGVALEMVLLFGSKDRQSSQQLRLSRGIGRPALLVQRETAECLDIIPTGFSQLDQAAVGALQSFLDPGRKPEFATARGKGLQKLARDGGDIKLLAGKNIAPMRSRGPWRCIDANAAPAGSVLRTGSVVFQNIVAHILNPADHIRLIGTVTTEPTVPLDTVNIIAHGKAWKPASVAAFLMSDFVCWYVYVCGFNRAVRTMHFDNYILKKLPSIPPELIGQLNEVVPDESACFEPSLWNSIDKIILASFGVSGEIAESVTGMHRRREVLDGSAHQPAEECADRMRDAG